ncbi:Uncharacterised protein [Mycobacteroides abscessus subsp. abscessus]|nr:Uncharacterised protein [Mycobacteroides abscessus subsp. abscessus]
MATSHCRDRKASTALFSATSDEAQAASTAMDGPRRLKALLIIAADMLSREPGMVNGRTTGTSAVSARESMSARFGESPNSPAPS